MKEMMWGVYRVIGYTGVEKKINVQYNISIIWG